MTSVKPLFKINTRTTPKSKNVVRVDRFKHWAPPVHMRLGVDCSRRTTYLVFLNQRFKESNPQYLLELVSLYNHSVKIGELTLEDGFKGMWVKEAFKDFLLNVMPALSQVTDQKVDIDQPFSGQQ